MIIIIICDSQFHHAYLGLAVESKLKLKKKNQLRYVITREHHYTLGLITSDTSIVSYVDL